MSLSQAREVALDNWKASHDGRGFEAALRNWLQTCPNPSEATLRSWLDSRTGTSPLAVQEQPASDIPTFEAIADEWLAMDHDVSPRTISDHHARLVRHAYPLIGKTPVDRVQSADLLPLFSKLNGTPTGRKLRAVVRRIFAIATAKNLRADNPAGDALTDELPTSKRTTEHRAAVPHSEVAAVLDATDAVDGWQGAKLALRFLTLTAARTGEVMQMDWSEIDLDAKLWTVPASKMKAGREHRVPLSGAALEVLEQAVAGKLIRSGLVFPAESGKALSNNALRRLLVRAGSSATVHGFRTSFRSWCQESGVSREVAEPAVAHVVGGVEGAYTRSDLLERRRELMDSWAAYLAA